MTDTERVTAIRQRAETSGPLAFGAAGRDDILWLLDALAAAEADLAAIAELHSGGHMCRSGSPFSAVAFLGDDACPTARLATRDV